MSKTFGRGVRRLSAVLCLSALVFAGISSFQPRSAEAHLATFGSWEITKKYLSQLFPEAEQFLRKKSELSAAQVEQLEAKLGFSLYPEDRKPTFYIATKSTQDGRKLLGVAIFIDPRVRAADMEGGVVRLEVGIAVDSSGNVRRVRLFDYKGKRALNSPEFLDQLRGRSLESSFEVGDGKKIEPPAGLDYEAQLVANAAREALLLMKVALGKS